MFKTGCASLIAVYDQPADEVAELWSTEVLMPREWPPFRMDRTWNSVVEDEDWCFDARVCCNPYDTPVSMVILHSSLKGLDILETIFEELRSLSIAPREVAVADEDEHSVDGEMLAFCCKNSTADEVLDPIESNHHAWALHSRRAFRCDTLADPQQWAMSALERGFQWKMQGKFYILDVGWEQRGHEPREVDPLTGLFAEESGPCFSLSSAGQTSILSEVAKSGCNCSPNSLEYWRGTALRVTSWEGTTRPGLFCW